MSIVRQILRILSPSERRSGIVLLVLMVVGMGAETLGLGLVIPVVTVLIRPAAYPQLAPYYRLLGNPSQSQLVIGGMLLLVGTYLLKGAFLAFLAWKQSCFVYTVQAGMSQRLFAIYLRQPWSFHLERNSAQLMRNATSELDVFTSSVLMPSTNLLIESMVIVGVTALLIAIEPIGALSVAIVLGSFGWAYRAFTRKHATRWGYSRQLHEGRRLQTLLQGLGGAKDVKLLGREADFLEQYRFHSDTCAYVGERQATMGNVPRLALEALAVSSLAALVVVMLWRGRDITAVIPTLAVFAAAAFRLIPAANRVLSALQALPFGVPVIHNLVGEFALEVPIRESSASHLKRFSNEIRLADVTFSYAGTATPTLTGLSIRIAKGECVGFIGQSGAGKSTLVDVVLGLLTPSSGAVLVDGEDIQAHLRDWQDQIGYVTQTIYLTDDTLRRNVAFGLPSELIDDAAVWSAIRAAQLMEFVQAQPLGLETVVGERGVRLSGGQRQRVGIARALYHNPAVLVLDEATSALDVDTEAEVMVAVNALHRSKTILIISHRASALAQCDRVYLVEHGTLVQRAASGLADDVQAPVISQPVNSL